MVEEHNSLVPSKLAKARRGFWRLPRHPHLVHPLAVFLSSRSLVYLLISYGLVLGLLAATLGLAYAIASELDYGEAVLSAFGTLIALDIPAEPSGRASALRIVGTAGAAVGLLMSVLLLGALVFKLFVVNEFRWRQNLSVTRHQGEWVLQGRFYSGLDSLVTDVQIRANIRFVRTKQQPPIVTNATLTLSTRTGSVDELIWPIAHPGVPYSFRIL